MFWAYCLAQAIESAAHLDIRGPGVYAVAYKFFDTLGKACHNEIRSKPLCNVS